MPVYRPIGFLATYLCKPLYQPVGFKGLNTAKEILPISLEHLRLRFVSDNSAWLKIILSLQKLIAHYKHVHAYAVHSDVHGMILRDVRLTRLAIHLIGKSKVN